MERPDISQNPHATWPWAQNPRANAESSSEACHLAASRDPVWCRPGPERDPSAEKPRRDEAAGHHQPCVSPDSEPLESQTSPEEPATRLGAAFGGDRGRPSALPFPPLCPWLLPLIPGNPYAHRCALPALALGAACWMAGGKTCEPRGRRAQGADTGLEEELWVHRHGPVSPRSQPALNEHKRTAGLSQRGAFGVIPGKPGAGGLASSAACAHGSMCSRLCGCVCLSYS